uniref:Uncharacterized protein n=1 Tax=Physcomitrium patens TaxID=3218 RepID=A0A7I4BXA2_PHYPA
MPSSLLFAPLTYCALDEAGLFASEVLEALTRREHSRCAQRIGAHGTKEKFSWHNLHVQNLSVEMQEDNESMDRILLISRCRFTGERVAGIKKRAVEHQPSSAMTVRRGREVHSIHEYGRCQEISIKRHLAKLHDNIKYKESFMIGVVILTSLMRSRYKSASRSEQRQLFSTVSKVATLLTTQFTGTDFWRVGLELFQAAKMVITQLDELMYIRLCTDVAQEFLDDDQQRKEVTAAAATTSDPSNSVRHIHSVHDPLQHLRSTLAGREKLISSLDRVKIAKPRKEGSAPKKLNSVQTAAQDCQEKRGFLTKPSSHKKKKKKHAEEVCEELTALTESLSVSLIKLHVCSDEPRTLTNPNDTEMVEVIATPEEKNIEPEPVLLVPEPEEDTYEEPNLKPDPVPLVPEPEVATPEEPNFEPEPVLLVPEPEVPNVLLIGS